MAVNKGVNGTWESKRAGILITCPNVHKKWINFPQFPLPRMHTASFEY